MQLTLLLTSPRVAPGLMSWAGWEAVRSAERLLASSPDVPTARAVRATGRAVEVLPDVDADRLLELAGTADVVWLADDAEAERLPGELAAAVLQREHLPLIEVLHASYDLPGARLLDLVAVMDRLREGCPWDREQTHRSLARYLLEETYETLEAIDSGDLAHLREELGDLLLQVVFHARIAAEGSATAFTVDDVAGGIVEKLVHRHPHVFGDVDVAGVEEVEANWETLKAVEKDRASVLEGIPRALPALALADKVLGRAARLGVRPRAGEGAGEAPGAELGDRLLALVVQARAAGRDAEQELRDAVRRLAAAVRAAEAGD